MQKHTHIHYMQQYGEFKQDLDLAFSGCFFLVLFSLTASQLINNSSVSVAGS